MLLYSLYKFLCSPTSWQNPTLSPVLLPTSSSLYVAPSPIVMFGIAEHVATRQHTVIKVSVMYLFNW